MPLIYRCFKNKKNGQVCYIPAGRYGNFLNRVKKMVNYVRFVIFMRPSVTYENI